MLIPPFVTYADILLKSKRKNYFPLDDAVHDFLISYFAEQWAILSFSIFMYFATVH